MIEEKRAILVVDDNAANLHLLSKLLSEENYEVRIATNGTMALASAQADPPDLLLLDVMMPDLDGYEVCKRLKSGKATKDIPIVFISAALNPSDKVKSFSVGGVDYITKPIQAEEVLARVKTHLALSVLRKELENRVKRRTSELEQANKELQNEISERTQAEDALRESEERYRILVETMNDGMVMIDKGGIVTYVNPKVSEMSGYEKDEILGRNINSFFDEKNLFILKDQLTKRKKGAQGAYEIEWTNKDGGKISTIVSPVPLFNDAGEFQGSFSVVSDVSERKNLEIQLRQAQKMEAIGTLAGGIAHDFNNILQAICGFSELGMDCVSPESETYNILKQISAAGSRATELVAHILTFSRRQDQALQQVRVQTILNEALKLLKGSLPATIQIHTNIQEDCAEIQADSTRIHQVILNLCTNAYHAMRENGGILEVKLQEKNFSPRQASEYLCIEAGNYVSLEVRDSGCGMDEETKEHIFEPFYTTKKAGEGTGMGLATVHGIVMSHNGTITVESEPGKGTSFQLFFPIDCASTGKKEIKKPIDALPKGTENILFVDDEEPIVRQGTIALERLGYTVSGQTSSRKALSAFENDPNHFHLVITDFTMPNLTGLELAESILRIRPDTPILICSGFNEQINKQKAIDAGVSEFVSKPILPSKLSILVREILDQHHEKQM